MDTDSVDGGVSREASFVSSPRELLFERVGGGAAIRVRHI